MKKIYSIMAAATLMGLAACSNDSISTDALPDGAVAFTATVENSAGVASAKVNTRASDVTTDYTGPLTLWYQGVKGLHVNADYTVKNGSWTATPPLYWDDLTAASGNEYQFYATSGISTLNDNATGGTVATNQSYNDGYAKADLLIAGASTAERKTELAFNLKHLMAQFTVTLTTTTGSDGFTANQLRAATVKTIDLQPDYTLSLASNIAVTVGTDPEKKGNITFCPDASNDDATGTFTFRAIVPAQNATSIVVTIAGNDYTMKLPESTTIAAGVNTIQGITAKKSGLTLGTVTVTRWVENNLGTRDIAIDITGIAGSATGDAPLFKTMNLWKGTLAMAGNKAPETAKTYSYTASAWSSTSPYYIDDVTATDRFYTLAENTESNGTTEIVSPITNLKDLVAAGPVEMSGGKLAITYKHLMTKLRVTLTAGTGFNAALTGATIKTPDMQKAFTLGYAATDNAIEATAADAAATAYTGLAAATDYIVVPQTLAANSKFIVTLANGNKYTATLTDDTTLAAGEINTLALTLNPTKVGVSMGVAAWTDETYSYAVKIDGVTDGGTMTGLDISGNLSLYYIGTDDNISVDSKQQGYYTYSGSAWSSTSPIYWDNIPAGDASPSFVARFVPDYREYGIMADYLVGKSSAGAFGRGISFTDGNDLTHAMSQISITLKAGKGWAANPSSPTAGENKALIDALTTRTLALQTLNSVPGVDKDGKGVYSLTGTPDNILAGTGNTNFTSATTYIVAPQTLTDAHKITLKIANGNTYTIKLSSLKVSGNDLTQLEPGKNYAVTLTVNETTVGLSAKIADWTNIDASGEGTPDWK